MMEAMCKRECFNSTTATLYKPGQIAEVDEKDGWVQKYFDVPQPKKAAEEPKQTATPPKGK